MLLVLILNICFCFFIYLLLFLFIFIFFIFGFNRKGWVSYSIVVEEIKDVDYTGTDV